MSLDDLEKEFSKLSVKVCGVLLIRGRRKGQTCQKSPVTGKTRCFAHLERQTCPMIRTKGIRKTQRCNRVVVENSGLCRVHLTLEKAKPPLLYVDREHDVVMDGSTLRDKDGKFVFVGFAQR